VFEFFFNLKGTLHPFALSFPLLETQLYYWRVVQHSHFPLRWEKSAIYLSHYLLQWCKNRHFTSLLEEL